MELEYWAATDVGRKRNHNEDNFLIDGELQLFVVADGMGGHAAGEVASALAVHTIRDVIYRERDLLRRPVGEDGGRANHLEVCTLLEYAVHVACERIFDKARREPEKRGMGTTVLALLLLHDRGYIAHVGDSRIYLLRSGVVYQLTEDHSMMNEMIRRGTLRPGDFEIGAFAAYKRAMTRAVGPGELVEVDTLDFDILPNDALLLCSDGLYEYIEDGDLNHLLSLPEIRDVPAKLVELANQRGGKDNITAVVVRAQGDEIRVGEEARVSPAKLRKAKLFEQLSNHQVAQICDHVRLIEAAPGQVIFRESDPGQAMYLVTKGSVQISVGGRPIAEIGEGDSFGEMALIDDAPRSATATVKQDSELLCLGRDEFQAILRRDSELAVPMLWGLLTITNERLRKTTQVLAPNMPPIANLLDEPELANGSAPPAMTLVENHDAVALNKN